MPSLSLVSTQKLPLAALQHRFAWQHLLHGRPLLARPSALAGMCRAANEDGDMWPHHLPFLLFSYRASPHRVTTYSPAALLYGRELRLPAQLTEQSRFDEESSKQDIRSYAQTLMRRIRAGWDEVVLLTRESQADNEDLAMMSRLRPNLKFEVGDRVLRRLFQRGQTKRQNKLRYGWEGPYRIREALERDVYILQDLENRLLVERFHVTDLRPWNVQVSEAELTPDESKIDRLLSRRVTKDGAVQYLVR